MPLPIVLATAVPLMAPAKLSTAAIRIAIHDRSTRVEMTVATAFAVSWKPLMKSNTTGSTMIATSSGVNAAELGMLDRQPEQHVGDVLAAVGHLLHGLVDAAPRDDLDRVAPAVEQVRHALAQQLVRLVLELVDADHALAERLHGLALAQLGQLLGHRHGRLVHDGRE